MLAMLRDLTTLRSPKGEEERTNFDFKEFMSILSKCE